MQIDLTALPDDPATLQQMLREVVTAAEQQHTTLHAMQQRDAEIDKLHLLIKRLLRQQFGRRSEQVSADQLQLALEDLEPSVAANEVTQDAADATENTQRRRRETCPNRNHGALPAHLPRYEVLIDVEQRDCPCCGSMMHANCAASNWTWCLRNCACVSPAVRVTPAGPAKGPSWWPRRRSGRDG